MHAPPTHLLDSLPVSVACFGPDHRITWCNARLARQLGIPPNDVVGHTTLELGLRPDNWGDWTAAAQGVMANGRPVSQHHLCMRDGQERLIHTRFAPLPGPDGRPEAVVAVAFVDDEVRELRVALSASEQRFQAFMDHLPAVAWLRDADERYLFVNREYTRLMRITEADRVGRHVREVFPPAVAEHLLANDEKAAARGVYRTEEQVPDGDGVVRPLLNVKFTVPGPDGRPQFAGIGLDISEEKRLAEERRALETKLQSAQKAEALVVLAGGVAHDFNNILGAVVGFADLGRKLAADGDPQVLNCFAQIEKAAERATDLCRQMLDFAGDRKPGARPVDLAAMAQETVRLLAAGHLRGVTVVTDLSDYLPPVTGDPTQLRQVVLNLLTNAAEATASRPARTVTVSAGVARDPGHVELPPGSYVRLAVTDNGIGMEPATAARVFDPFFTTKATGRGLGLAAVSGIARGHGGAIHLTTAPDAGSTFEVLLPVAPEAR